LKLEMAAHPLYDAAIAHCESVRDNVTRNLPVHIAASHRPLRIGQGQRDPQSAGAYGSEEQQSISSRSSSASS
jgi:hypothetical protein